MGLGGEESGAAFVVHERIPAVEHAPPDSVGDDLTRTYAAFEQHGLQLAVILSTTVAQTAGVIEHLNLNYPLYSDESWDVFRAYGTGHVLSAPRQAWLILEGEGIVRWVWRSGQSEGGSRVPMPMDVLAVADELFGSQKR